MRTIFRVCLVAAVVAAVGLAAVPMAEAKAGSKAPTAKAHAAITKFEKRQNRRIRRAKRKAAAAHDRVDAIKEWNFAQGEAIGSLQGLVDQIIAGVPEIVGALEALEEGLVALQAALENDVGPALEAIDDALNDSTTGLVGLNNARPQFAVLAEDATFLGGTGAAGGSGPEDDTDTFQGGAAAGPLPDLQGMYVVDFNNDVSERMYAVNVLPIGPASVGGAAVETASAVNCSADTGYADLCGLVQSPGGASDPDPNKVLVQYGDGTGGGPVNGFSVTAISG